MSCDFCPKESIKEIMTDYVHKTEKKEILFKNVPALECEKCGDIYFKNSNIKAIKTFADEKENDITSVDFQNLTFAEEPQPTSFLKIIHSAVENMGKAPYDDKKTNG